MDLQQLKADYERDGYLLLPSFLPPDLLARLQKTTADFVAQAEAGNLRGQLFDVININGVPNLRRVISPEKTAPVYDET